MTEAHTSGFTVVGNHLAQHRGLSCLAIGLAVHIQSLRAGSPVDIRSPTERFPEGRDRFAAALRELERHGYLERRRERLPDGTWTTVTYAYNNPAATTARRAREAAADAPPESGPGPVAKPAYARAPAHDPRRDRPSTRCRTATAATTPSAHRSPASAVVVRSPTPPHRPHEGRLDERDDSGPRAQTRSARHGHRLAHDAAPAPRPAPTPGARAR
ncbi:helix-turn-helix domain-containing protein [Streptomyces sp. WMMC940]|uniref:helix-turn-helix domain-containing protein n=1 Tax=Streptomyces sp. WMMC940 TaxID=3015153 RepID=UPI003FCC3F8F